MGDNLDRFAEELGVKTVPIYVCENFVDEHPIYYDRSKMWWVWDVASSSWKMVDDVDILNMVYDGLGMAEIVKNGVKGQYLTGFQMVSRKKKPADVPKEFVQFGDVVMDIERSQTMVPTHEIFYANPIPWNILTAADDCPIIDKMFEDWVGPEQKQLLYEICAYSMLADYPLHRIFCLIGPGRNGKGTFMRILKKLIGMDNVCSTSLDRLADSRFEAAKLYKKLVAFVGETNFSILENTALIKSLVGQDLIPAEFKNKPAFDFMNYAKIVIATNSLPTTTDKTLGFYSRWIIIDFNKTYDGDKDILESIPDSEFAALAKKCVGILGELLERGKFTNEGDYQKKMDRYEEKSNPMKKFIATHMKEAGMEEKIPLWDFRNRFLAYLADNRFRRLSEDEIKGQLRENGIEVARTDFDVDGYRKQWVAIFGYVWKDNKLSGTLGSVGTIVPLNSLYEGTKYNIATNDTNTTKLTDSSPSINSIDRKCESCREESKELFDIQDRYDPLHRMMKVCQKCYNYEVSNREASL